MMNSTKKKKQQQFKDLLSLHEKLIQRLGDDLVYSLSFDQGQYWLSISTHRSDKQVFSHRRNIQTALIDDFNDTVDVLVEKIVELYAPILVNIEGEKDEVIKLDSGEETT